MERYLLRKDAAEALELVLGYDREDSIKIEVDTNGY
jgi:hypothetical protein